MSRIIYIIIPLCILVLLCVSHTLLLLRQPDELRIIQSKRSFDPSDVERRENQPIVITDIYPDKAFHLDSLQKGSYPLASITPESSSWLDEYGEGPPHIPLQGGIRDFQRTTQGGRGLMNIPIPNAEMKNILAGFRSSLTVHHASCLHLLPQGFHRGIAGRNRTQTTYYVESGEVRFQIYHPRHRDHLTRTTSVQNLEKDPYARGLIQWKAPDNTQAQYVEVILRAGQAIVLPHIWLYDYTVSKPTILLHESTSEWFTTPYLYIASYLKNSSA